MEVKEKNKKLLIVVGVLLLFGGISLAYFVSKAILGGNGGSTSVTTAVINGATLNVEGVLSFEDLDILPGHKTVSSIKVTATGNNELIPYNLIWQGTNTLTTPLNFTIYKTSEQLSVTSACSKKTKIINGAQALSEECKISNIDKLGNEIASGTINKNDIKVTLVKDEFVTAVNSGISYYYYIILEYPNLDEPQNEDLNGLFEGKVTVEESNIKPDVNILAAYIEEDGAYKQVEDIPQEGYTINREKSTCSNGAKPTGVTPNITINNLNKSGTSCYLYFDKKKPIASETILANVTVNKSTPDFSKVATTDEGVFMADDPMYGTNAKTYYWRGAVTNNYVKFANKCWRIVRINGDGSLRLIYDGTICHQNGATDTDSIESTPQYYGSYDKSEYVGYTHVEGQQRGTTIESNLKIQNESWYTTNLASYAEKIDASGNYCNDRNTASGYSWNSQPGNIFYYAGYDRSGEKNTSSVNPTFSCSREDIYTLKIGMLTVDEVIYAGGLSAERGSNASNKKYYLYTGRGYWTMTPYSWFYSSSSNRGATVFGVNSNGTITWTFVHSGNGLRPVINLRSDVTFSDGDGTKDNPYIVAN